jgi:hypothetical protein
VNAAIPFNLLYRTAALAHLAVCALARERDTCLFVRGGYACPIEPGMRLEEVRPRLWGQPA